MKTVSSATKTNHEAASRTITTVAVKRAANPRARATFAAVAPAAAAKADSATTLADIKDFFRRIGLIISKPSKDNSKNLGADVLIVNCHNRKNIKALQHAMFYRSALDVLAETPAFPDRMIPFAELEQTALLKTGGDSFHLEREAMKIALDQLMSLSQLSTKDLSIMDHSNGTRSYSRRNPK